MELPFSESELHAILVHFPIALAIAGVPFVFAVALAPHDRLALRWTSVVLYLAVAASAYAAVWSGERARGMIPNTYPDAVWETLEIHEQLAETVWIGALISAVFLLIGAVKYKWVRVPATTVAFVASAVTAVLVGTTGHFGGQLVYKLGVGTPGAAALYGTPSPAPAPANTPASVAAPPVNAGPDRHFFQGIQGADAVTVEPNTSTLGAAPAHAPTANAMTGVIDPTPDALSQGTPAIRPIDISEAKAVSYVRDVVPILDEHCYECHDEYKSQGELLLTSVGEMLYGGEKAGPAIIPGHPDTSPLILYVRGILKPQMPKRKEPLSEDDVHILRMWIQAGAVDDSGIGAK